MASKEQLLAKMWTDNRLRSPEFSRVADWLYFATEVCAGKGVTLSLKDKDGGLTTGNLKLHHPYYKGEEAEALLRYEISRHKVRFWAARCSQKAEQRTLRLFRGDGG